MMRVPPEHVRNLQRLSLAGTLVAIVGFSRGLDTAMVVALSIAVMEIDAHLP